MPQEDETPEIVPVPRSLVGHLNETAVLLDIDGTLLTRADAARGLGAAGLAKTLIVCCSEPMGAGAGQRRSLNDIDLTAPDTPAVGGHGAETSTSTIERSRACSANGQFEASSATTPD